ACGYACDYQILRAVICDRSELSIHGRYRIQRLPAEIIVWYRQDGIRRRRNANSIQRYGQRLAHQRVAVDLQRVTCRAICGRLELQSDLQGALLWRGRIDIDCRQVDRERRHTDNGKPRRPREQPYGADIEGGAAIIEEVDSPENRGGI